MISTDVPAILTDLEASRLGACEKVIERGLASFVEVGEALLTIRDNRLYRSSFSTFEDYCKERWGITRQRAHQLIDAYEVVEALPEPEPSVEAWEPRPTSTMVDNAPILRAPRSERQARELAPLRDQPEVMREVWQQTVEETDGKPTAVAIRERVEARRAPIAHRTDVVGTVATVLTHADRAARAAREIQRSHLASRGEEAALWRNGLGRSLSDLAALYALLEEAAS